MFDLLADIGYLLLIINLVVFLNGFKSNGKAFKIFTVYIATMFVIQVIVFSLNHFSIHNLFVSHFYFILQFIILSIFYLEILKEKFQKNIVKVGLSTGIIVLGIQYMLDSSLVFKFNLFEIFITSFLLIMYSAFHFYNSLNEEKEFYYVNTGVLVYLFGSTVIFLAGNLVATLSSAINTSIWIVNAFLYVVYQLFVFFEWKRNYSTKAKKLKQYGDS